jgi:hypothetical protein
VSIFAKSGHWVLSHTGARRVRGARLSGATSPIKIGHHRIVDSGGQIAKINKKFFNLALRKEATPIFMPYALWRLHWAGVFTKYKTFGVPG